jgi:hypothetical protein
MKRKNYNLVVNIEDTIRAKELDLELVKVKGHSDNRWNSRADSIAKKGANIQDRNEIIEEPVLRSNITLFWEDKVVENLTRDFVKEVLNIRNNADWSCSSAVKKLEPDRKKNEHCWVLLWKKIKNQSGTKCISTTRSKRLSTLFKCIQEKMPILKELVLRRPDLYTDAKCIVCKEGKEEDQDHLATCSFYKNYWIKAETLAITIAWSTLSEEKKKSITQIHLKEAIWGQTEEESAEVRKKLIKGLLHEELVERVQNIVISVQETRNFLMSIVDTIWNEFYEKIWKERCNKVTEWEKSQGISTKKKRSKNKAAEQQNKVSHKVLSRSRDGNSKKIKDIKKEKETESENIEDIWRNTVRNLINNNKRPYWNSLKG